MRDRFIEVLRWAEKKCGLFRLVTFLQRRARREGHIAICASILPSQRTASALELFRPRACEARRMSLDSYEQVVFFKWKSLVSPSVPLILPNDAASARAFSSWVSPPQRSFCLFFFGPSFLFALRFLNSGFNLLTCRCSGERVSCLCCVLLPTLDAVWFRS